MTVESGEGYGHPHPPKSGLLRKRVAGVPVVYLAGGVVLILAVYAWKLKGTPVEVAPEDPTATETLGGDTYPGMPLGTVIVAPATNTPNGPSNSSIETNDQWLRLGVALLIKTGKGAGTAQEALQAYLNGNRLSYDQGVMRDMVLNEYGLPPYPPDSGGTDPRSLDPTSSTVPVAPIPVVPVIPAVNTPVPVDSTNQWNPNPNPGTVIYETSPGNIYQPIQPPQEALYANRNLVYTDATRPWLGQIQTEDSAANRAWMANDPNVTIIGGY